MTISKPELPFKETALEPYISKQTLGFHYGKHHMAYFNKMTAILKDGPADQREKCLEELVKTTDGVLFNQAAQTWNHSFYWNSLKPTNGEKREANPPTGPIAKKIDDSFGSFEAFRTSFSEAAIGTFGSGWAWLVLKNGKLEILSTKDADNPMKNGRGTPILTCDVWEHAYYLDYQNDRGKYVESWWALVNWEFANKQLEN